MIYTIAHTKGGVGKTTTVWHLICELSRQKRDFIVIDLDHQRTVYNLTSYLREKDNFKVYTADNLHQLQKIIEENSHRLIIIDTGGNGDQVNKQAIKLADKIITPIGNDSITEAIGFKKFEAILHELGSPDINILFCNIRPNTKNFEDIKAVVSDYKNTKILNSTITTRSNYKQSMGQGLGVTELPKSKNKALNDRLKKSVNEIKTLLKELEI